LLSCGVAFYTPINKCPYCGHTLRTRSRGRRKERKYINPEKYEVKA